MPTAAHLTACLLAIALSACFPDPPVREGSDTSGADTVTPEDTATPDTGTPADTAVADSETPPDTVVADTETPPDTAVTDSASDDTADTAPTCPGGCAHLDGDCVVGECIDGSCRATPLDGTARHATTATPARRQTPATRECARGAIPSSVPRRANATMPGRATRRRASARTQRVRGTRHVTRGASSRASAAMENVIPACSQSARRAPA